VKTKDSKEKLFYDKLYPPNNSAAQSIVLALGSSHRQPQLTRSLAKSWAML
jgi:hypothetical protein